VWFWPYADELARHRDKIAEMCAQRARLEPMIEELLEYQGTLFELEELERLIVRFRAERAN
jgi:hypothetical protein